MREKEGAEKRDRIYLHIICTRTIHVHTIHIEQDIVLLFFFFSFFLSIDQYGY